MAVRRILFVDDEQMILRSLKRLFFDSEYEVFFAESGEEGLRILATTSIDLVVSDMRMPQMNGHQFLRKVKAAYPSTTRIILSGYADEKTVMDTLIDGSSGMYLSKPWSGHDLKKIITQIMEAREVYKKLSLLEFVNKLDNLSLVTGVYQSVCILMDRDAEIREIAEVIETDPGVCLSILRVINSAFFNIKTSSVARAISLLGLTAVKSIVLSCALSQATKLQVLPFTGEKLAQHACATNRLMLRIYSELLQKPLPENLSTAGLLHNIGVVMLSVYFPDAYTQVLQKFIRQTAGGVSLNALEEEAFGVTHAELGGYLLDWWGFPYANVECALFHNEPIHSAILDKEAVCVVHLASCAAWRLIAPELNCKIEPEVFAMIHIGKADVEQLIQNLTLYV